MTPRGGPSTARRTLPGGRCRTDRTGSPTGGRRRADGGRERPVVEGPCCVLDPLAGGGGEALTATVEDLAHRAPGHARRPAEVGTERGTPWTIARTDARRVLRGGTGRSGPHTAQHGVPGAERGAREPGRAGRRVCGRRCTSGCGPAADPGVPRQRSGVLPRRRRLGGRVAAFDESRFTFPYQTARSSTISGRPRSTSAGSCVGRFPGSLTGRGDDGGLVIAAADPDRTFAAGHASARPGVDRRGDGRGDAGDRTVRRPPGRAPPFLAVGPVVQVVGRAPVADGAEPPLGSARSMRRSHRTEGRTSPMSSSSPSCSTTAPRTS